VKEDPASPSAEKPPGLAEDEVPSGQANVRCFRTKGLVQSLAVAAGSGDVVYAGVNSVAVRRLSDGKLVHETRAPGCDRVACSADGRSAASAGSEGRLDLWAVSPWASKGGIKEATANRRPLTALALSPDGKRVLTAGLDYMARVWDPDTGKETRSLPFLTTNYGTPRSVAYSPDGSLFAVGFSQGVTYVSKAEGFENNWPRVFKNHDAFISCVAVAPDNRRVVTGSWDKTVKVTEAQTGKVVLTFTRHQGEVDFLAVSADGRLVLSGGRDRVVRLWELDTGKEAGTMDGHTDAVTGVGFLADGREAVSGSRDGTIRLWKFR
jgi:WD40 repeat protein